MIKELANESIATRVKENISKDKIVLNSYLLWLKNKLSIENAYNECIEENIFYCNFMKS